MVGPRTVPGCPNREVGSELCQQSARLPSVNISAASGSEPSAPAMPFVPGRRRCTVVQTPLLRYVSHGKLPMEYTKWRLELNDDSTAPGNPHPPAPRAHRSKRRRRGSSGPPAARMGRALRNLAPKLCSIGECYVGNHSKNRFEPGTGEPYTEPRGAHPRRVRTDERPVFPVRRAPDVVQEFSRLSRRRVFHLDAPKLFYFVWRVERCQ